MFFPDGAYIAGPMEKLRDCDRSKGDREVQQTDKNTGLPLWTVDVIDADPKARQRPVKVKVAAEHAPVLPTPPAGSPFTPVEFTGSPQLRPQRCRSLLAGQRTLLAWTDWTRWAAGLARTSNHQPREWPPDARSS